MGRITLSLPDSLHRQLKIMAAAEGVSINQYIAYLLTREVALDETMARTIQERKDSGEVGRDEVEHALHGEHEGDAAWRDRIVMDPSVKSGKPVVKGTRLGVGHILNLLANGATVGEILEEHEGLIEDDIQACLALAAEVLL